MQTKNQAIAYRAPRDCLLMARYISKQPSCFPPFSDIRPIVRYVWKSIVFLTFTQGRV